MTFEEWYGADLTGQTFEGDMNCYYNDLTSLKGCPKVVNGAFDCSFNQLTSLEHCPEIVNGSFYCEDNELTSLEHGPKVVTCSYYCHNNRLTTLEGVCYAKNILTDFSKEEVDEYLAQNYPEMTI